MAKFSKQVRRQLQKLLDYLQRRFPRLARFIKKARGALHLGSPDAPERVSRLSLDGSLLRPRGFGRVFDPTSHPALPALQRRAAHAIFARLGLEWVPSEYLSLLRTFPNPVEAFEEFCREFGLQIDMLRREASGEVTRLRQCVGILLELTELKELNAHDRRRIITHMHERRYDRAEGLVDIARAVFQTIRKAEELTARVSFPHCRAFLDELRTFRTHPFDLSDEDARSARALVRDFLEWQDRFDVLIAAIDSQIGWMVDNWPDNKWGREQEAIKKGLIRVKEEIEDGLKSSDAVSIADELGRLETVYRDLLAFVEEIKKNHGGKDWSAPADDTDAKRWAQWLEAASQLGFKEGDSPTPDQIKKAYRREAFRHHPDRFMDKPASERKEHETAFKRASEAREILERGKPKKPAK